MERKISDAYARLLDHGIKPSMQRLAIMEYLMAHRTHPSADEIFTALVVNMPTLSKTTVYNTLKLFAEQGAALMLTIDDRNANFDADTSIHSHFQCKRCGRIYDIRTPEAIKEAEVPDLREHSVTESHYYYKGICKECLKTNKEYVLTN
ncbi:MAG: transcriptional repressor [Mediterranea sp.]|jgi:Fur family ferric uptake transcriptional regulator/Fur family peroxide stress response transcriptional regulator|nr:transcriptional repressor [Mediterranea sp.]